MEKEVDNKLYKKKRRKLNWSRTWDEFDDEYPGLSILVIVFGVLFAFGALCYGVYYCVNHNPWYILYAAILGVVIFFIHSARRFLQCAKYD